jgi:hypothetical protein
MRPSPTARIALGAALIGAVVAIALALAQEGAEAPDRIDYFGDTDTDDCTVEGAIGPHLCLTDAPPTPTPDFNEPRENLALSPGIDSVIAAAEAEDADQLMAWTLRHNICDIRYRQPLARCIDNGYVEGVWQSFYSSGRVARDAPMMGEWVANLLVGNQAHLVLVGMDADRFDEFRGIFILLFHLGLPASLDGSSGTYDYLALRVRDEDEPVIEEIGFGINETLLSGDLDQGIQEINNLARFRIQPTYCHSSFVTLCSHLPTAPRSSPVRRP